ncbi:uncharacterized protein LOC110985854 [Acanthaster planci]|uniref:Uncharacterized protein LOC110985854 n=1 Tax=Acanthaster planci TaxID=133434 RepID=A0A8B7ZDA4_ACAPL|nr:uncharacterized protein LOC110985854 [Acanthaster planci]
MLKYLVVCFLLVAPPAYVETAPLHRASQALPNSYIIKLKDGVDVSSVIGEFTQDATVRRNGVVIQDTFTGVLNGFTAKLSEKSLHHILALEEVEYVSENGVIPLPKIFPCARQVGRVDQQGSASQWGLDRIDQRNLPLDGQYNPPNHGENVEIWVFDSGIRATHQDFAGRSVTIAYDVNNNNGNDPYGHGTLVTSVAAGNHYGAANKANIVVANVIGNALGTWSALIKALDIMFNTATKPAVASISLGQSGTHKVLEDAMTRTMDKGFTIAVAAGNDNVDACQDFPANFKRVITVGASTKSDTRWYASNHGSCVDIFAPGKDMIGAYIRSDSDVETVSGTSEATPLVSGAVAILLSTQKDLNHDQVKAKLLSNATPNVLQEPLPGGSPNLLLYVV